MTGLTEAQAVDLSRRVAAALEGLPPDALRELRAAVVNVHVDTRSPLAAVIPGFFPCICRGRCVT
jgi:hypothetical protein